MRILILCAATTLALASSRTTHYAPRTFAAPELSDDDLFDASVRVLGFLETATRQKDRPAGIILGEWAVVNAGGYGSQKTLHAWRILISDRRVTVAIDCQTAQGTQNDCGDERNPDWVNLLPKVERSIRTEAARLAAERARRPEETGGPPAPAVDLSGTERGPCYGNGTCDNGLTCASGLCVRLPPAAACPPT